MNRRNVLLGAVSLPGMIYLGGCASVPQIVSDANTIANGISAVLPTIQTLTGLAGGAYNTVVNAVTAIKSAASTLASATGSAAIDAANAIPTALAAISSAISSFKVPAWVSTVIAAAQTVAPVIITALGVLPRMAATATEGGSGLSVDQARAILLAAATK
jgi:hypothetical protein